LKPIAIDNTFHDIGIVKIEHGALDKVAFITLSDGRKHNQTIHFDGDGMAYFNTCYGRIYFNDCLRCNQ
jgi:hypothetical protein